MYDEFISTIHAAYLANLSSEFMDLIMDLGIRSKISIY